jgi:hypothetical protein
VASQNNEIGIEIVGSDAKQSYKGGGYNGFGASGVDEVVRNGAKYIRFTMRPGTEEQYLRSYVAYFDDVKTEYREKFPQALMRYAKEGPIALYFESGFEKSGAIDAFHDFFNAYRGLFPQNSPFLTLRRETKDQVIEANPATNASDIPTEIPITIDDILSLDDTKMRFQFVEILTTIYKDQVQISDAKEYEGFKDAVFNAKNHLLREDFGAAAPQNWSPLTEYRTCDYLFNPAAYILNVTPYEYDTKYEVDVLSTLLFLSQDEELMTQFTERMEHMQRVEEQDEDGYPRPAEHAKKIVHAAIRLLQKTDPQNFETNFPLLSKLSYELNLDALEAPATEVFRQDTQHASVFTFLPK